MMVNQYGAVAPGACSARAPPLLFRGRLQFVRGDPDPYLILGVPSAASQAEITHAYRARLRDHHPDTRSSPSSRGADERLRQVLDAYALLRDPARRADYDRASTDSAGRVDIPITHRRNASRTAAEPSPPLWAGPVRRHGRR